MTNQLTALVTVKGWPLYGCLKELERTASRSQPEVGLEARVLMP
jgi:hypothetical protein